MLLDKRHYEWEDKYKPRKPRFFNRVKTGFEWNKYNQTHYDHDNPPPKIVQGKGHRCWDVESEGKYHIFNISYICGKVYRGSVCVALLACSKKSTNVYMKQSCTWRMVHLHMVSVFGPG